jgi:hypothetical protein
MKRLSLADFRILFEDKEITPETKWSYVGHGRKRNPSYLKLEKLYINPEICSLLGIVSDERMGWFSNPAINHLPASIVIEKVNRAMEQLGMIDE